MIVCVCVACAFHLFLLIFTYLMSIRPNWTTLLITRVCLFGEQTSATFAFLHINYDEDEWHTDWKFKSLMEELKASQ